jgi:hypothetical protein
LKKEKRKREREREKENPGSKVQLLDVGTFLKKMFFLFLLANFSFQNTTVWEASIARSRKKFGSFVFAK